MQNTQHNHNTTNMQTERVEFLVDVNCLPMPRKGADYPNHILLNIGYSTQPSQAAIKIHASGLGMLHNQKKRS